MNGLYNPLANSGGLLGALGGALSQQEYDYQLQKLAAMQQQSYGQLSGAPVQRPVQPPAPNPVLLLCGDEE